MNKNISNNKRSPLKERQPRYPGQSLEKKVNNLQLEYGLFIGISGIFIVLVLAEWFQWFRNLPPQPLITTIVAVAVFVYSYIKIRRIKKQLPNYKLGLRGERQVGYILNQLITHGYTVLHDIWTGDFNIDHVVISEHGIFAIETKAYSKPARGEVLFDGKTVKLAERSPDAGPVDEAVRHARWLRKVLGDKESTGKPFTVKPVVLFPGWYCKDTGHNKDVWVLNPEKMLETKIAQEPISLEKIDVAVAKVRLEPYSHYETTKDDTFE